jgi:hypothetical protein
MRSKFPAYYRIHKDDLLARFDDCVFMFDACALLDIYRMKKEVADDVFKVIEHLKEQIRIPYHVAEEYFDNIHNVLKSQMTNIKNSRTNFERFIQDLEAKRSQPYISKKSADLLEKLKVQVKNDFDEQENYITNQLIYGEYQNRMNDLLEGKVLETFSKEELEEIEKEGEQRRESKIPPGYKDADKSSNRNGDLINWKEILRFAKNTGKCIVIVSSETKEDWVIREQGHIICLRYELLKEFYETVGNNNQWIYFLSLDRFLEYAREKDAQVISEDRVKEVKDYVAQPADPNIAYPYYSFMPVSHIPDYYHLVTKDLVKQIESWQIIQESMNPKGIRSIRDAMEKMGKQSNAGMLFNILTQKASKVKTNKNLGEDKATSDGLEGSAKEKTEE